MSKQEQVKVGEFIESYLKHRKEICLIIFLVDIRHDPTSNDFLMYDYVIRSGLPCMILTNKADKIAKTKVLDASKNIQNQLNPIGDITTLPFSSEKKWSGISLKNKGNYVLGAPEFVLKEQFNKYKNEILSYQENYRVLAVAHSNNNFENNCLPQNLELLGFVLISDKIRKDAKKTLEYFKN